MLPALIGAGASLAGGILGLTGARETNAANASSAHDATVLQIQDAINNRQWQGDQANAQMAFQERMANTEHQRAVEDLKKAGLNPILAAGGGNASPSGASGSGAQGTAQYSQAVNPMAGASSMVSSALEALTAVGGIEKQKAETELIRAQTGKSKMDTKVSEKDLPRSEIINDVYDWARKKFSEAQDANAQRERDQNRKNPLNQKYKQPTQQFEKLY